MRRPGFDEGVKAKSDFDSDLLRVPSSGFRVKGTRFRQGNTASADLPVGSRPGDTNKFTMFTRSMSGVQDTPTHLRMNTELTADCVELKPLTPPPRTSKSRKNSLPQEHHERAKQIRKSMIDLPDHLHQRAEQINNAQASSKDGRKHQVEVCH